jgi:hypothetical protein
MTRHEQIMDRMRTANPVRDFDEISAADLLALRSSLDSRIATSRVKKWRRRDPTEVDAKPWRARLVAFGVAFAAAILLIGAIALLPRRSSEVVDVPNVTTTTPQNTTRPPDVTAVPSTVTPAGDGAESAALELHRVGYEPNVFGGNAEAQASVGMADVTFGHGTLVAVGATSAILGPDVAFVDRAAAWVSTDAEAWQRAVGHRDLDFGELPWADGGPRMTAVAATDSGFVAVGDESGPSGSVAAAWTSPDGLRWTRAGGEEVFGSSDLPATVHDVTASGDEVIAVGELGDAAAVWRSSDGGVVWSLVTHDSVVFGSRTSPEDTHAGLGDGRQAMHAIVRVSEGFVVVGASGGSPDSVDGGTSDDLDGVVWRSIDGVDWRRVPGSTDTLGSADDEVVIDLVELPDRYVAVGALWTGTPDNRHARAAVWTSTDLSTWVRVADGHEVFGTDGEDSRLTAAVFDGTRIVAVGEVGSTRKTAAVWTSTDGITWQRLEHASLSTGTWLSEAVTHGDQIVLVGGENLSDDWRTAHAAAWRLR